MITVVVGTDGSDLAVEAAGAGLSLLGPADRVVIVAVAEIVDPSLADDATGHASASMTHDEVDAQHSQARAQGQAALEVTAEAVVALGVPATGKGVETVVIDGDPGPALCSYASDVDADVVIVGSRGRGGIKRAFLGSVSDYVVRNAPCPVVVTRARGG
ncbi:MAG TPA: universal stress protein [Acidimicrobiales bacterium]|nr:universal stress protein [Acidimicrobiales bacterium]